MLCTQNRKDKWLFIINFTAGRGRAGKKINELILYLNKYGFDYDIEVSKYAKHAIELARRAVEEGYEKIIAVGGDGTANEVINGIMQSGKAGNVTFGIIPEGAGNDFARVFTLSRKMKKAVQRLKCNKVINIDIGKVEDYYFLNSLGMGFDAVVAEYASKFKKINGFARYFLAILKALIRFTNYKAKIIIDGEEKEIDFTLFSVGNGQYCGGGIMLTPNAKVDDGLLDIGIVSGLTRRRLLKILPEALQGKHLHNEEVEMMSAEKFQIISNEKLPVYFDGEIPILKDCRNITIEILKSRIRFLA